MNGSVFPIGHYGGQRPGDTPEAAQVHVVRVGWQQHRLSEDVFGVWVLAHGTTESGRSPWTADDILRQAEQVGLVDAKAQLEELAAMGAVVVVGDDVIGFARGHRMEILFVGLGNSPENPEAYAVGVPGLGTAAVLDSNCYELWQWGSVAPTLWHSCEVRATVTAQLGQTLEPVDAADEILGDLRFLVAHGCAYLDVVPTA